MDFKPIDQTSQKIVPNPRPQTKPMKPGAHLKITSFIHSTLALTSTLALRSPLLASVRKPIIQNPSRSLSSTAVRYSTPMAAPTDTAAAETAASSGVTPDSLGEKLKSTIGATYVSIEDMSGGCGQAFNAIIVSPEFEKKTLLARHRLVNNALKSEIAAIHAWTPKCLTPEQWDKEKEKMS